MANKVGILVDLNSKYLMNMVTSSNIKVNYLQHWFKIAQSQYMANKVGVLEDLNSKYLMNMVIEGVFCTES